MLRSIARILGLNGAIGLLFFLPAPCWAAAPAVVAVVPASGASTPDRWIIFTATYSDADGWKNLREVRFRINLPGFPLRAAHLRYVIAGNRLYLLNNTGTAWLGGSAPGQALILQNGQVRLDVARTRVSGSGRTLTITWRVSFKPAFVGHRYTSYLWAQDNLNSTGFIAKGDWAVDATPPTTPTISDDGAYYTETGQLHATWIASDAESGITEYQYAIGTAPGGTQVVGWTSAGPLTEVTRTGLSLADGAAYHFSVKARNGAGLWSSVGSSDGIVVDTTPPSIPAVTDSGVFTNSTTSLNASWTSSDPHTGIAAYRYRITRASPTGPTVADWTPAGTSTTVNRAGLALSSGVTYYFGVQAQNAAGSWSSIGASDGIRVDASAPSTPVVVDDGASTKATDRLHASWSSMDSESGIAEYQYAIGTAPGGTQVVGWTSAGLLTEVTRTGLSLADGAAYYFSVKARNGAGLGSEVGVSDGIVVDLTPPSVPVVTDDGAYTASATQLHATWTASSDAESGVADYQYQIRRDSPGGTKIRTWTSAGTDTGVLVDDLWLTNGTRYYISVRARNGAGLGSEVSVSDGIVVDLTPPSVPVVTDDGHTTTSTTQLHATWTASSDAESGVADYQYQIRRDSTTGALIRDWTLVGVATDVTTTGLSLTSGTTYYFGVQAANGAGLSSVPSFSNGITVDTTPPAGAVTINSGAASTKNLTVTLSLSAGDNAGPVSQMKFSNDGTTYSAPEPYATSKTWTLASGDGTKTVYAKFKDLAGNWSAAWYPAGSCRRPLRPTPPAAHSPGWCRSLLRLMSPPRFTTRQTGRRQPPAQRSTRLRL